MTPRWLVGLAVLFWGSGLAALIPGAPALPLATVFFLCCGVIIVLDRTRPDLFDRPLACQTTLDDQGVRRDLGATVEQVAWDDLVRVSILTTDEGPLCEDFFWVLQGAGGTGCVVPMGDAQRVGLLQRLQQLPGFDSEAVIAASTSTEHATFVCWEDSAARLNGPRRVDVT